MSQPLIRLLILLLLSISPALQAARKPDAAARCQTEKTLAAGQYSLCRMRAETAPYPVNRATRLARCDQSLNQSLHKAEARAKGACLTTHDFGRIQVAAAQHGRAVGAVLDGPGTETGTCAAPGVAFAYSYMITNRATPFATDFSQIVPAAPGNLSYFTATGAYQSSNPQTNYQEVSEAVFLSRLTADLAKTTTNGQQQLGLYIHGLGNLLTDAMTETAQFGCSLAQSGEWTGLLIGFSWPSYDLLESGLFYATSGPPLPPLDPQRSGSIRDNILGSRTSFASLLNLLQSQIVAPSNAPVALSLLTHSEGNYMLMAGLAGMSSPPSLSRCAMLAADISAVSLQTGEQGQAITESCRGVTVYYSGADVTLGSSNYEYFQYHQQDYPTRLGQAGPYYGFTSPQLPANVTGVDCSSVTVYPAVAHITDVHSSYRSVPVILADIAQTLLGKAPTARKPISGTTQGFTLSP